MELGTGGHLEEVLRAGGGTLETTFTLSILSVPLR